MQSHSQCPAPGFWPLWVVYVILKATWFYSLKCSSRNLTSLPSSAAVCMYVCVGGVVVMGQSGKLGCLCFCVVAGVCVVTEVLGAGVCRCGMV